MDKWIEIASKNGVNGVIALFLIAAAWFFYKKIWPILEKRLNDADTREKENLARWEEQGKKFMDSLKEERDENAKRFDNQGQMFMEAIRRQGVLYDETHKAYLSTQREITRELKTLNQKLKNGNGK